MMEMVKGSNPSLYNFTESNKIMNILHGIASSIHAELLAVLLDLGPGSRDTRN